MKSVILLSFFLVLSFLTTFAQTQKTQETQEQTSQQDEQKTIEPELPNYRKDPFISQGKREVRSALHPDWGILLGELYVSEKNDQSDVKNFIMVFFNQDGTEKSVEWVQRYVDSDGKLLKDVYRSYLPKNGKFVFEKKIEDFPVKEK